VQQDAGPVQQDGPPASDAAQAQQDATPASDGAAGDAGGGEVEGGCGCRTAASPGSVPGGALVLIVALGVALGLRRRRS
jgi:MYXO-CTERM domain-containing protein